jgi:hypothetical protein
VAAVLIDSGYVETMLSEASVMLARQGRLPARDELRAFEGSGLYLAPAVSSAR